MPVSAGSASRSASRGRAGCWPLPDANVMSASAVAKRSVLGAIVRPCSASSWRVSAIAWPIELALTPSRSESTFIEQSWR